MATRTLQPRRKPRFGFFWATRTLVCAAIVLFLSASSAFAQPTLVRAWEQNTDAVFVPDGLTNVVAIAAGPAQSVVLNRDGTVVGWGDGGGGPDEAARALNDIAAISVGWRHGMALRSNGVVVAWGEGPFGENTVPAGLSNIIAIAAGGHYNLALKSDRTVVAWGQPGDWLNVPNDLSNVVAISASAVYNDGQHNVALRSDGTVAAWGANQFNQSIVPSGLSNVTAVAAGYYHCLALKSGGTVVAWGNLAEGGQPPADLSNVVAIAAGAYHNLALKSDGTVVSWKGNLNVNGPEHVPADLSNVVAIAAGSGHSLALSTNLAPFIRIQPRGQPVWESSEDGFGFYTEARGGLPLSYQWQKDGVDIAGATNSSLWIPQSLPTNGGSYTLVVSNPFGSVTSEPAVIYIWPFLGIFGQPQGQDVYVGEDVTFSVHVKGSAPFHYQWRKNSNEIAGATSVPLSLTNVQISDAGFYDVVVTNIAGSKTSAVARLRVNTAVLPVITKQPQPETVWPGAKVGFQITAVGAPPLSYQWRKNGANIGGGTTANLFFTSAQDSDAGSYDAVVSNSHGAVTSSAVTLTISAHALASFPPAGTVVNLTGAVLPEGLTNIVAVSAGLTHALALREDGTVAAWGSRFAHVFGTDVVPPGLSNVIAISAGAQTSLALRDDGTLISWGRTFGSEVPQLYGVVGIAVGTFGGAAVKHDGRVAAWGDASSLNNLSNVASLALGPTFALAVHRDGIVRAYGLIGLGFSLPNSPTDAIAAAIGVNLIALKSDGVVVDLLSASGSTLPAGLDHVVAISGSTSRNLALKTDGTVVGWGNVSVPSELTNATAIAAGELYTLVVTANPPSPSLVGAVEGDQILLSAPVAVSGYVLEATDDLSKPYTSVGVYTNTFDLNQTNNPALMLPVSGPRKFYRFRKQ